MGRHDHEFYGEPEEVLIEDDAVVESVQCTHRPIRGSQHSERLDETFYDEGPQCEAVRWRKFHMDIEPEPTIEEWERLVLPNEGAIIEAAVCGDESITLDVDGIEYHIEFEKEEWVDY